MKAAVYGGVAATFLAMAVAQESSVDPLRTLEAPVFSRLGQVERLTIERDRARLTLSGRLALGEAAVEGRGKQVVAAAFKGQGVLELLPPSVVEMRQLLILSGAPQLKADFSEAVFVFSDGTAEELTAALGDSGESAGSDDLYQSRFKELRRHGRAWDARLYKALMSDNPESHAFFAAEVNAKGHDWLSLTYDESDPEQLEVVRWKDDFPEVWTKFPKGNRSPQEAFDDPASYREYLIPSYRMDVTLEKNERLSATVEMDLDVRSPGERVLLMSLDPDLRVESVSLEGQEISFFQPPKDRSDTYFASYLGLVSAQPFRQGVNKVRLTYEGKGLVRKVGNGSFFCRSFGWYPAFGLGRFSLADGSFTDRADFEITLRVPKNFEGVSVGRELERTKEGEYEVSRWKSEIPLAVAGFAFGRYKTKTEKVGEVEIQVYANDEADDFMKQIKHITDTVGGFTLGSLSPSSMRNVMATEVGNSLRVMETYFGEYPFSKLAVVNIPYSYGQGWPSLLYLSSFSFLDGTQRHQLGLQDSSGITDFFRAHETSHQWWGHVVGWKSYHDQWLSEGFAQFSGNLYIWFRQKPAEYFERMKKDRESFMHQNYNDIGPIYLGRRLSNRKFPLGYSRLVYEKGGWVLHMLRMLMYDEQSKNADERFIAMMKDFTKTHFNKAVSTDDFKKTVEKHMLPHMNLDGNGTMDWFFDAWVYGYEVPEYELETSIEPAAEQGKWNVSGTLIQKGVSEGFRMMVPLYLHQGDGYMKVGFLHAVSERTPFQLPELNFKPDRLSINQLQEVLTR